MNDADRRHAQRLRIRRGMDVYDAYQQHYVGSVIDLISTPVTSESPGTNGARTESVTKLIPEQTQGVPVDVIGGRRVPGEELGPYPTVSVGNTGPISQSAEHDYATGLHEEQADVHGVVVRPGTVNPFARPLYIPVRSIRSIAMDRLILDVTKKEIPLSWYNRQAVMADGGEA